MLLFQELKILDKKLELFPPVLNGGIFISMKRFIITEEERTEIRGLYESIIITSPSDNEWCRKNVGNEKKQICIIKTPSGGDQSKCQKDTGSLARRNGYINPIKIDVNEPNYCKSVWERM